MRIIIIVLLQLVFMLNVFGDVYTAPETECCYEISKTLKNQNNILVKYLDKILQNRESIILVDNCTHVIIENNCCLTSVSDIKDNDFNWINFIAQIATIIGLLFAIITYWLTERNKKREIIRNFKSLAKYFYDRIKSYLEHVYRQTEHLNSFIEKLEIQPHELQSLKIEGNEDANRINKIESVNLFESLDYLNKPKTIDNDYYNILYGVSFGNKIELQAQDIFDSKYVITIRKQQEKILQIRTESIRLLKTNNSKLTYRLAKYKNQLEHLSGNLYDFYNCFYKIAKYDLEKTESKNTKIETEFLVIVQNFCDEYYELLDLSKAFKDQFNSFRKKLEGISNSLKIYINNLKYN